MPKPNRSLPIPVDLDELREHHRGLAVARNREESNPSRHRRLLSQEDYRFAEYLASLGPQRINRNQATLTLQFLKNDKSLTWRDVRALMTQKNFKEYVEAVRHAVMDGARMKAESQTLKALDFHYDAMESLHNERDWRTLWRYTDPYVKAALPRGSDEAPPVAVQINISAPQQQLLTQELPPIEVEATVIEEPPKP